VNINLVPWRERRRRQRRLRFVVGIAVVLLLTGAGVLMMANALARRARCTQHTVAVQRTRVQEMQQQIERLQATHANLQHCIVALHGQVTRQEVLEKQLLFLQVLGAAIPDGCCLMRVELQDGVWHVDGVFRDLFAVTRFSQALRRDGGVDKCRLQQWSREHADDAVTVSLAMRLRK